MRLLIVSIIVTVVLGCVGYVKNVISFINLDFKAPYKAEIVRGLSIPLGIGAITGWVDIKDN